MTRTVAGDDIVYRSRNIWRGAWAPSEIEPHGPGSWPPPPRSIQVRTDLRVHRYAALLQSPRYLRPLERAQDGPSHQDRQHFAAPLRIDADVRQRPALLVRAPPQLAGEPAIGGPADQIVQALHQGR